MTPALKGPNSLLAACESIMGHRLEVSVLTKVSVRDGENIDPVQPRPLSALVMPVVLPVLEKL